MCAARKQRLTREAIGGSEVWFPENVIRNITIIGLVLLVALVVAPPREKRPVMAGTAIDARIMHDVPQAKAAAEPPAEGNVVDLTY